MADITRAVRDGVTRLRSELRLPLKPAVRTGLIGTIAAVLLIAGLCCLLITITNTTTNTIPSGEITCKNITTYDYRLVTEIEYTNCDAAGYSGVTCHELTSAFCTCNVDMDVPQFVEGDVVVAYSLPKLNDTVDSNFYQSRDDNQLSGNLSSKVSESCRPFAYDNDSRTIAPCGALANAMYTDKIIDITDSNSKTVPRITYGLLREEEKKGFHNPAYEDLAVAFQNFSKPKDWKKHIYELDPNLPENNGFQNEAFIVWMRTDLKIKPLWRLNRIDQFKEGLPKDIYTFTIQYNYPYSLYNGSRNLILYQEIQVVNSECHNTSTTNTTVESYDEPLNLGWGITCILFAAIVVIAPIIWRKLKNLMKRQ